MTNLLGAGTAALAALALFVAAQLAPQEAPRPTVTATPSPCYACPRPGQTDHTPAAPKLTPTPVPYPAP